MASPAKKALKRWRALADEVVALAEQGASLEVMAEHRRMRTRYDPALFALVYLSRHLVDKDNPKAGVGLADVHAEWAETAKRWMRPSGKPMADRRAEVAPREMGKSTWWFLILPMWAAAHGWVKFAAAFADSAPQAETHLASFKAELENNALLRYDYPDLVRPKTRGRGQVEADRVSLYHAKSGFVFAAAGADSRNLGMKVGDLRPDLLIIDDIEPHEGMYSAELAKKRLDTLISAIFPLNIRAHVIIAGTVTMAGSIIHQIVRHGRGEVDTDKGGNGWVGEQKIRVRHTLAITTDDDGRRRSVWPEKWPLKFLTKIEHTRAYAKNYANDPLGAEGDYWELEDIARAREVGTAAYDSGACTRILVSVDPAVTAKKTSDYSAVAVIAWQPPPPNKPKLPGRCVVLEVRQVKKNGAALRLDVMRTVEKWEARLVLVETNQGGDLWQGILWGLPVPVKQVHQQEAKELRAARSLKHYQRGRVGHAKGLTDYEGQLAAFPRAPHDDMVDAAGSGILYFLDRYRRITKTQAGGTSQGYAG